MRIRFDSQAAVFEHDGVEAGRYVLDDPFKSYIHPLRTPQGHCVSDCMPADHRHHKGLMFGLRCDDLNFWEEEPDGAECGVQTSRAISGLEGGNASGFRQELRWQAKDGGLPTYDEVREVLCRHDGSRAFHWTWRSRRTALRGHRLVKSPWSISMADGRRINYHGLGLRLPWVWAFSGETFNGVEIQGRAQDWNQACGTSGPEVTCWGRIDGHWSPPTAAVTFRQEQSDTWFVLKADFSYLSIGPSNAEEIDVAQGRIFQETYHIIVQDR
jgi:hypothetical protein